MARHFGEHAYPAEDLEPSVATFRLEQPTTSPLSAEKATTPRSQKRTRRPAEKQGKLDNPPRRSADSSETAPVSSTSGLPPVSKPPSTTRQVESWIATSFATNGSGRKLEAQD